MSLLATPSVISYQTLPSIDSRRTNPSVYSSQTCSTGQSYMRLFDWKHYYGRQLEINTSHLKDDAIIAETFKTDRELHNSHLIMVCSLPEINSLDQVASGRAGEPVSGFIEPAMIEMYLSKRKFETLSNRNMAELDSDKLGRAVMMDIPVKVPAGIQSGISTPKTFSIRILLRAYSECLERANETWCSSAITTEDRHPRVWNAALLYARLKYERRIAFEGAERPQASLIDDIQDHCLRLRASRSRTLSLSTKRQKSNFLFATMLQMLIDERSKAIEGVLLGNQGELVKQIMREIFRQRWTNGFVDVL